MGKMTFERAARAHIASRGSAGTRKLYSDDLDRWVAFCMDRGTDVDSAQLEDSTAHRDELLIEYGAQTVRRILSALSSMYQAAGVMDPFNDKLLKRPSPDDVALTRDFTSEQAERLIEEAFRSKGTEALRDAALLQVLYETGLRVSPTVEMKRAALTKTATGMHLLTKVKKRGRVEVELPAKSVERLESWLAVAPASVWVFPDPGDPEQHLERLAVNRRMRSLGRACGIEGAHPHRFRATFATQLLDAGVAQGEVQAAMHLADPRTLQRYDRGKRGTGVTSKLAEYRKTKI